MKFGKNIYGRCLLYGIFISAVLTTKLYAATLTPDVKQLLLDAARSTTIVANGGVFTPGSSLATHDVHVNATGTLEIKQDLTIPTTSRLVLYPGATITGRPEEPKAAIANDGQILVYTKTEGGVPVSDFPDAVSRIEQNSSEVLNSMRTTITMNWCGQEHILYLYKLINFKDSYHKYVEGAFIMSPSELLDKMPTRETEINDPIFVAFSSPAGRWDVRHISQFVEQSHVWKWDVTRLEPIYTNTSPEVRIVDTVFRTRTDWGGIVWREDMTHSPIVGIEGHNYRSIIPSEDTIVDEDIWKVIPNIYRFGANLREALELKDSGKPASFQSKLQEFGVVIDTEDSTTTHRGIYQLLKEDGKSSYAIRLGDTLHTSTVDVDEDGTIQYSMHSVDSSGVTPYPIVFEDDGTHTVILGGDNSFLDMTTFKCAIKFSFINAMPKRAICTNGANVVKTMKIPTDSELIVSGDFRVKSGVTIKVDGKLDLSEAMPQPVVPTTVYIGATK